MSSLVTDVGTVNGELKEVKSKLDSIMSLLFNMGHAVPSNHAPQSRDNIIRDDGVAAAAAASEGGGASYGGGGDAAFFIHADPPAATAHGGYCQRFMGEASGGGGGRAGGHGAYARGALFDYRTTPRRPVDHQQGHLLYPELSRQTSAAEPYPVVPNQVSESIQVALRRCARRAIARGRYMATERAMRLGYDHKTSLSPATLLSRDYVRRLLLRPV